MRLAEETMIVYVDAEKAALIILHPCCIPQEGVGSLHHLSHQMQLILWMECMEQTCEDPGQSVVAESL